MLPLLAVVVVLGAVVAILVVSGRNDGDGTSAGPQPLARTPLRSAPEDWVAVRASLAPAEAEVVRGLLSTHGVRAVLEAVGPMATYGGASNAAARFRLCVAPEDVEAAEELLRG
jgi:hypothetical protein